MNDNNNSCNASWPKGNDFRSEVTGQRVALQANPGFRFEGGRGPALAVAQDRLTGEGFIRLNETTAPPADELHPIMEGRIQARRDENGWNEETGEPMQFGPHYPGKPGSHAESLVLNDALAREAHGIEARPENLNSITINVVQIMGNTPNERAVLEPGDAPKDGSGDPFVRCVNCRRLTDGADVISDNIDQIAGSDEWRRSPFRGQAQRLQPPGDEPHPLTQTTTSLWTGVNADRGAK